MAINLSSDFRLCEC